MGCIVVVVFDVVVIAVLIVVVNVVVTMRAHGITDIPNAHLPRRAKCTMDVDV